MRYSAVFNTLKEKFEMISDASYQTIENGTEIFKDELE